MHKRTVLNSAILLAIALPVTTHAAIEVSGYLKNETAAFTNSGQVTGCATSTLDTGDCHDAGDVMKFENSARFFINGDLGEKATWHADVNLIYDTEGVHASDSKIDYRSHEWYTQNDWLRELYVDSSLSGWDFRLGKQQLVWGTADGIKLLDIINPTDYRELNQNTMEDSRIPIWMLKVEKDVTSNGNLQFVVSQSEKNKIAGLETDDGVRKVEWGIPADNSELQGTDRGHSFIMKGVDTITGEVNGFLNIGPAMGAVTTTFWGGGFTNPADNPFAEFATVGGFSAMPYDCGIGPGTTGADCLKFFTELTNNGKTNLIDDDWDINKPNSMWEFMPNATFATFNAFVGMNTRYKHDDSADNSANFGMRWKGNTDGGLSYSLNYLYAYDPNPAVDVSWRDPNTGDKLKVVDVITPAGTHVLQLMNPKTGKYFGAPAQFTVPGLTDVIPGENLAGPAQMQFTEHRERIHNLGASFDYSVDTGYLGPVVLRGEFLYQKDVLSPVIDREKLSYGALTDAFKMEEGDYFKYVLGADVTVLTNLLISGQFIQYWNLDYVNDESTCETQAGVKVNCSRYTGDQPTMSLTNGFKRGYETKEFFSLFFSKPFGESQRGRWNNITIWEEGGGFWNRFDVEYSFSDNLLGTAEWNQYWGNDNTIFGQFENSSNIQVGLKYLFD